MDISSFFKDFGILGVILFGIGWAWTKHVWPFIMSQVKRSWDFADELYQQVKWNQSNHSVEMSMFKDVLDEYNNELSRISGILNELTMVVSAMKDEKKSK